MPRRLAHDPWLFGTAGLLMLGGVLMVGSASHFVARRYGLSPSYFLMRQMLHLAIGTALLLAFMYLPYPRLADRRVLLGIVAGCVAALIAVLATPEVNGAHRWLPLGPLRLQPSEFTKVVAVVFTARLLSRKEDRVNDLRAVLLPLAFVLGTLSLLVLVEPDLGAAFMLILACGVMVFVAGLRWRAIAAVAAMGALVVALSIVAKPYRLERIRAFMQPGTDARTSGWQLDQSLLALGSGGVGGVGFGQGQQKAYFLPEAHTDFIFSVVGEEFGIVGAATLLAAFLILFWRGMRASLRAPCRFGFYLALGITSLLVLQGLTHMGVCVGLLPTKGLAMPYLSYGGSSLLATLAATGVLLNVSQHGA